MYYRARWYEPVQGRFISQDPVGLSGGIDLYSYVENDPLRFSDPSGLCPQKLSRCAQFVAGLMGIVKNAPPFAGRVNIGREMLSAVELSLRNNEYTKLPYDGFKEGYIKNQFGWAEAHIMGVAGASLVGDSKVVPIIGLQTGSDLVRKQFREDYGQLDDAIRKKNQTLINEKTSEINDDYAGMATGALIDFYLRGTSSYEETRRAIFEGLCEY